MSPKVLGCEENCISNAGTHGTLTILAKEVKVGHALDRSRSVKSPGLRERIVEDNRWYSRPLLSGLRCCIRLISVGQNKSPFWLDSLTLIFNLSGEQTRQLGQLSCKVPLDLMKMSVKEPMHTGFYNGILQRGSAITWSILELTRCQ